MIRALAAGGLAALIAYLARRELEAGARPCPTCRHPLGLHDEAMGCTVELHWPADTMAGFGDLPRWCPCLDPGCGCPPAAVVA